MILPVFTIILNGERVSRRNTSAQHIFVIRLYWTDSDEACE